MHLAYLISNFPKQSETFVSREVLNLKQLGHTVTVFAFSRPQPEELAGLPSDLQALAKGVHYIDRGQIISSMLRLAGRLGPALRFNRRLQMAITMKSNPWLRLGRACAVAAAVERLGVTHLHAHWPYASQVATLVHQLTGLSYSVSIHAHEVAHDNGHFPLIFPLLSFATFCNRAAMEYLLARLPDQYRAKAHLIYHGVDLEDFPAMPLPQPFKPLRIVSAGRLTPTKGFDRLLQGCAQAVQTGVDLKLTILGQGALYEPLQQQAAALGMADRVHLPGWVAHDQVRAYLAQAHLFALLADTGYHDGLPNVVLEAMATGRPVILSPLPAVSEAVTNDQEGIVLTGADDVAGLARALQQMARSPDQLAAMGTAARARMVQEHSASQHIRKLAACFTSGSNLVHISRHQSPVLVKQGRR